MYEQIAKIVDLAGNRPAGLILHTAHELPSGDVEIVDVWESADAIAAFGQQRIFPAFAQAGVLDDMLTRPQPVAHETFEIVR